MKAHLLLPCSIIALFAVETAHSSPIYWDGPDGGWDATANWSTDPAAAAPDPLAVPGSNDVATFNIIGADTAAVVSLNVDQAASGLSVLSSGTVTLQGGGTDRILSLGAGGIIAGPAATTFNIGDGTAGQNVSVLLMADQSWLYDSDSSSGGIQVKNGVSLGVTGAHTLTLGGAQTSTGPANTISGAISDGLGTLNLTMAPSAGNNRWALSGNNTYKGLTTVSKGGLTLGNVNALGSTDSGTVVVAGASVFLRTNVGTIAAEAISLSGTGVDSKGALRNVGGVNTWTGAITLASSSVYIGADGGTFTLGSTADISRAGSGTLTLVGSGTIEVNGNISGAVNVTRGTSGVTTFGGDSKDYTGATSISSSGTLVLTTALTATSGVTVTGTLRGDGGSINTAAATTVAGTLSPGLSASTIGTLTVGALSLANASTLAIDINSDSLAGDVVNLTDLTLAGTVNLTAADLGTTSLAVGTMFKILQYSGRLTGGPFTINGILIGDEAETFTLGANTFQANYDQADGSGHAVTFTVVPEPAAIGLLACAAVFAGVRRRRGLPSKCGPKMESLIL